MVETQKANEKFTLAQVVEAIQIGQGIKAAAARHLGCDWQTIDRYIKRYKTCEVAYVQASEVVLDVAESNVVKAIIGGSIEESKWYLVKKGRARGYGEIMRQEGDLNVVNREEITLDLSDPIIRNLAIKLTDALADTAVST